MPTRKRGNLIFQITVWISLGTLFSRHAAAESTVSYVVSFEHAVHHEARIAVTFTEVPRGPLEIRMSRSSPGRYALHEFAKNVYGLRATDGSGRRLRVQRPTPHRWDVWGHDGTVKVEYWLFADRADGTYSAIGPEHAHLNMPATFVWARALHDNEKSTPGSGGKLYSMEANAKWADNTSGILPADLTEFCEVIDAPVVVLQHEGVSPFQHMNLPDAVPNIVYLDGPELTPECKVAMDVL